LSSAAKTPAAKLLKIPIHYISTSHGTHTISELLKAVSST
jgi:hypothetical protein